MYTTFELKKLFVDDLVTKASARSLGVGKALVEGLKRKVSPIYFFGFLGKTFVLPLDMLCLSFASSYAPIKEDTPRHRLVNRK